MTTVALVGVDGAGKTTIARRLLAAYPERLRYLYMGISIGSSNVSLPTSRYLYRRKMRGRDAANATAGERHVLETRVVRRGRLGTAARELNRLAEEWYRHLVATLWQQQGFVVLFDRHFRFEYARRLAQPDSTGTAVERLHEWSLRTLYPVPNLTLFLDVPPAVALERKSEWPPERLAAYRDAILTVGRDVDNFVILDATQPVDSIIGEIRHLFASTFDPQLFPPSSIVQV